MSRTGSIRKNYDNRDKKPYYSTDRKSMFKSSFPEWKPEEDINFIKILPPKADDIYFGFEMWIHWQVGDDEDAFLCPKKTNGEDCPICLYQAQLMKELDEDEKWTKEITSLFPQARMVYFIVDTKDDDTIEKGVQIYPAPYTKVDKEGIIPLCVVINEDREETEFDISLPENMKDVTFTRKGKKQYDTVYSGFKLVKSTLTIDEVKGFIEQLPENFNDILDCPSYEEIESAFGLKSDRGRDRGEREEKPRDTSRDRSDREEKSPTKRDRGEREEKTDRKERDTSDREDDERTDRKKELKERLEKLKNRDK